MDYRESVSNQKPKQYKKQVGKDPLVRRANRKALPAVEGMWLLLASPDAATCASVLAHSRLASYFYPVSHAENWESHPSCRRGHLLPLEPFPSWCLPLLRRPFKNPLRRVRPSVELISFWPLITLLRQRDFTLIEGKRIHTDTHRNDSMTHKDICRKFISPCMKPGTGQEQFQCASNKERWTLWGPCFMNEMSWVLSRAY